jgi:release factor glutamine methyltransferase
VEAVTGVSRADIVAFRPGFSDAHVRRARDFAARRAGGEPLQYITGVAGFRELELAVGPGVLIPRPETEVVAGRALERMPDDGVLVDVGTGSGAIALAVAYERPAARVVAIDSSHDALGWARQNMQRLDLDIELLNCDLLSGLPGDLAREVDVVVSNPPYVAEEERDSLPVEVVEHEPEEALFAEGNGMSVIRQLAADALVWLRPGGWLVLEIAADRGADVASLLEALEYRDVSILRDLAGRERIAEGRRG